MKKKKVLIFHPALAPYRIDFFNALSRMFDVEVVFLYENVWYDKFNQAELLSQLQCKCSFLLFGPNYKGRVFRFGMFGKIKSYNPDYIFGYEYSFTTQYLIFLKRAGIIDKKIGSTIDDSLNICFNIQSKSRDLARKYAVSHLDYFIFLSNEVADFYQNTFGIERNKIIVSPLLQDPKRLRNESNLLTQIAEEYSRKYELNGKKVLLFVGRFVSEKALPRFIKTVSTLISNQPNLVLVLVGEGKERKEIEEVIEAHKLENKIILPGRVEGNKLYAWYLSASGFFLPSVYEPFGAVVNEALIFGLKVFCSKYAGASSLILPEKGLVFDPLSEDDTVLKLSEFIKSVEIVAKSKIEIKESFMPDFLESFKKRWEVLSYD